MSLLILKHELGWKEMPVYRIQNKTEKRKDTTDFDEDTLQRIRELNKYDISLFEFAKRKNSELIKNYDLESALTEFQKQNSELQKQSFPKNRSLFEKIKNKLKSK